MAKKIKKSDIILDFSGVYAPMLNDFDQFVANSREEFFNYAFHPTLKARFLKFWSKLTH